ncbi:hypothetical protein [Sedimenticola selenatireducens]|uniref:hypothetical protein n=1 Tax=Sedimenticola selenatireducens TaxID=191960 RepID=UPI002AAB8403|nr:hypothetical protein [Sedimenticola selenatireducens]
MKTLPLRNSRLPYSYHMLWVSLASSLVILSPLYLLLHFGMISLLLTVWITVGVIVLAALYESSLLFILTRHMLKNIRNDHQDP